MTEIATRPTPLRFRGRSFVALVLAPEAPLKAWMEGFDEVCESVFRMEVRRKSLNDRLMRHMRQVLAIEAAVRRSQIRLVKP